MMKRSKLLIVEDNRVLALALSAAGERCGFEVKAVPSLALARKVIKEGVPDAMLLDLGLPDGRGLDLLDDFRGGKMPMTAMLTAHGEIDHAIAAKKAGVVEFFLKPVDFKDLERFLAKAVQRGGEADEGRGFSMSFIGGSAMMRPVFQAIAQACVSEQPVLVRGGAGSGCSHVAHLIHEHVDAGGPFVVVQCGEFTGDWGNVVVSARGGSLVLDGVDRLSLKSQVLLERVVAASQDVKWIAICGKEGLLSAVREHAFHPDLYYRLQGVEVVLPSLRERIEDFRALCLLFLAELAPSRSLLMDEAVYEALEGNGWAGNLKELKSVLRYAVITSDERTVLTLDDFPVVYRVSEVKERRGFERQLERWVDGWFAEHKPEYRDIHDDLERMLLEILMDRFEGNQALMARNLEMNRATLRKKLRREMD